MSLAVRKTRNYNHGDEDAIYPQDLVNPASGAGN